MPNGTYLLYGQGFYRQDGSDNTNLPLLFANDYTSTLSRLTTKENTMGDAGRSFLNGNYEIPPVVVTVTNGTLTIGVKNTVNKNLWVIWDNLRLYYLGDVKVGDVNGDGRVSLADLALLVSIFNGKSANSVPVINVTDVNRNGTSNLDDVNKMVELQK